MSQPPCLADVVRLQRDAILTEWEAEVRSLYDGMVRIVVTPTWVKLIDFETTLPSAVEELVKERAERQLA